MEQHDWGNGARLYFKQSIEHWALSAVTAREFCHARVPYPWFQQTVSTCRTCAMVHRLVMHRPDHERASAEVVAQTLEVLFRRRAEADRRHSINERWACIECLLHSRNAGWRLQWLLPPRVYRCGRFPGPGSCGVFIPGRSDEARAGLVPSLFVASLKAGDPSQRRRCNQWTPTRPTTATTLCQRADLQRSM